MNSIVKNINSSLNIIFTKEMKFYDLISEIRYRLNIISSKNKNINITLRIKNHLDDKEKIELEETILRFNITKFKCINY